MDKGINRINAVLAKKGGSTRLQNVSWRTLENLLIVSSTVGVCPYNGSKLLYQ